MPASSVVVFAGPSLSPATKTLSARCELRPPIRRGGLQALIDERVPATAVLLDGLFGSSLAVTPTECRNALERGWTLVGASSMGALRASELWSLGMIGIGRIYEQLRLGHIDADAEVAVAYHPDSHEELTVSLVHVRELLDHAFPSSEQQPLRELALTLARRIYWAERSWPAVLSSWKRASLPLALLTLASDETRRLQLHPKRRDAELALRAVLNEPSPSTISQ